MGRNEDSIVELLGAEYRATFTGHLEDQWVPTGHGCSERDEGYNAKKYEGTCELFYKQERVAIFAFGSDVIEPADVERTPLSSLFPKDSQKGKIEKYLGKIHKQIEKDISDVVKDLRSGDHISGTRLFVRLPKV